MMSNNRDACLQRAVLRAALALLAVGPMSVALAATGEQWEYSGTMEMMGMKMPTPPVKVCQAAGLELPPQESRCKVTDVKRSAGRTTYRVACAEPNAMSGAGEMTRKGDIIESTVRLKSAQGEFVLVQTGTRLGACELTR